MPLAPSVMMIRRRSSAGDLLAPDPDAALLAGAEKHLPAARCSPQPGSWASSPRLSGTARTIPPCSHYSRSETDARGIAGAGPARRRPEGSGPAGDHRRRPHLQQGRRRRAGRPGSASAGRRGCRVRRLGRGERRELGRTADELLRDLAPRRGAGAAAPPQGTGRAGAAGPYLRRRRGPRLPRRPCRAVARRHGDRPGRVVLHGHLRGPTAAGVRLAATAHRLQRRQYGALEADLGRRAGHREPHPSVALRPAGRRDARRPARALRRHRLRRQHRRTRHRLSSGADARVRCRGTATPDGRTPCGLARRHPARPRRARQAAGAGARATT